MNRVYVVTCLEHQRDKAAAFGVEGVADCKDGATKILDALFHRKCDIYGVKELNAYEHYTEGEDFLIGEQDFACIGCIREIGVQHSEDFPVLSVQRADLEQKGFDTSNLGDEWMEKIASKAGDILLDGDYWDAIEYAAEHYNVPRKSEEPTIIKADTAGRIVMFGEPADDDIYYVGAAYGHNDGIVYKDKQAFEEHDGICYVPEAGFFKADEIADLCSDDMKAFIEEDHCGYVCNDSGGYTRDDLYAEMYDRMDCHDWVERMEKEYGKAFVEEFIDKETAYVFQELDWQCPSTFMDELDWEEDWKQYLKEKFDDPRLTNKQKEELYG